MTIETFEVFGEDFSQVICASSMKIAIEEFERVNGVQAIGCWNVRFNKLVE